MQALLFPDPRPLVERLGSDFFRKLPEVPGVYLMRDSADEVLYVGKAKNLRKRLCSYRVANPDRMPRRHLRLLRAVAQIEFQECADERSALAREGELLRSLKPRFNRAGTWPGTPRFLLWRVRPEAVELSVAADVDSAWRGVGPLGAGAGVVRAALVRLLWLVTDPGQPLSAMPHAWFRGRYHESTTVPLPPPTETNVRIEARLAAFFCGDAEPLRAWICEHTTQRTHPFELAVRDADLETILRFAARQSESPARVSATPGMTTNRLPGGKT